MDSIKYPPRKAYKFMEPQWLEKLKRDSKFFINHLNNYPEEVYGNAIGDNLEGHASKNILLENYTLGSLMNKRLEKELKPLALASPGSNIFINDFEFVSRHFDVNQYVYCLTFDYSEKIRKEFGGAVLIIEDFYGFSYWLNRKMEKRGNSLSAWDKCQYVDSRAVKFSQKDQDFSLYPGLIKDSKHSEQKEFRFLWRRNDDLSITQPIFDLYVPEALKYCRFEF
ncbi:hypothetical protein C6W23_18445 [Bacillus atrophaeus]|nr:hypothetical protein C6W23_18445 [Bacillus atrophaeus]